MSTAEKIQTSLPTTLGDTSDAIAVDQKRVRETDDGGLSAVWVPIVGRSSDVLQEPEAKILATRWAARMNKIEGGIVRTMGPMSDDGKFDPTVIVGSVGQDGRSSTDDYLRLAAEGNTAATKTRRGYVIFCLIRANEASY